MIRTTFTPGRHWLDTSGNGIQAHGGSVIYDGGFYYWYGENKERTHGNNGVWHWGVRCYRSSDLYNWEDLGLIIPPVVDDTGSPLHPSSMMDRPHIIFNSKTGKYVCWLKIMEHDGRQTETILVSDHLTGPYEIVRTGLQPLGMNAGDFDLVVGDDGKAYYYFEHVHTETICAELTDDYTDVNGRYSTHFQHSGPPFTREATAHFIRHGKHYLITSGTTGYLPNPSQSAIADTWHGPFTILGDTHPDDKTRTSYHSQISSVFRVQGKRDLYIAMADRWAPAWMGLRYSEYAERFQTMFERTPLPGEVIEQDIGVPGGASLDEYSDVTLDTSQAEYVWLPIQFEDDVPIIKWHDEWRVEDYE
ncbi:family 43 glycosylhydrolase [Bifidobacterium sp. SO4]|uniref:family 43 glycosylhydrolase n=1 Tax=Bifidobacterium sp. SO4 TaxID=2809030 RepID=UPI001BDD9690|nr:family 43 glycosylhydrolase [Bifidobacterium sp. SO4]MBT1170619.1 family 43 glycosylhydrolase [Bifidobacterium sp. SO4]